MTTFRVYQAQLTEAQRNELNGPNGGWDSKPEFTAYAGMGMGTMGDRNADSIVREAAEFGLFVHTSNITANDVTEAFEIGNIGPEEAITRIEGRDMYSVSVGNVMVDLDTNQAWMCDNFGWVELSDFIRKTIEASTATKMVMEKAA